MSTFSHMLYEVDSNSNSEGVTFPQYNLPVIMRIIGVSGMYPH